MPKDSMLCELYRLSDVVDALREELGTLETQLDRDGETRRYLVEGIEVELKLVVGSAKEVSGEGGGEGSLGAALSVLGLPSVGLNGTVGGKKAWSDALTQTVKLRLRPSRFSQKEAQDRQRAPGTASVTAIRRND
jgi:hypothetical protein